MKLEYDGYNEKINQIYFNPYSSTFSTNKTNVTSSQSLGNVGDNYGLPVNSMKGVNYASECNINGDYGL